MADSRLPSFASLRSNSLRGDSLRGDSFRDASSRGAAKADPGQTLLEGQPTYSRAAAWRTRASVGQGGLQQVEGTRDDAARGTGRGRAATGIASTVAEASGIGSFGAAFHAAVAPLSVPQQLQLCIATHNRWRAALVERVNAALQMGNPAAAPDVLATGPSILPESWQQLGNANLCMLGEWLKGYHPMAAEAWHYRRVREFHDLFHAEAGRVAALLAQGRPQEAKAALSFQGSFSSQFGRLMDALVAWRASIA